MRLSLPKSRDKATSSPVASHYTNATFLSPTAAPHRVLSREGLLCLPDCTAATQAAHVCCLRTLTSGGTGVTSHINTNTRTNVSSYINEGCLRYAQASGLNALKGHLLRPPGTPTCCTLLMNAKMNLKQHNVRLFHNQCSSKDPSVKLGQSVSDQTQSGTHVYNTELDEAQLTHTDTQGRANMVDVGGKVPTRRTATARATVILGPTAFRLLRDNQLAKGDALAVAQLSGIMASKHTSALIPLCHPLPLDHASVTFNLDEQQNAAVITATCRTTGKTGVEMEALTAVSVAALTIYDMCKAVSHDIIITDVKLVSKTGGKRDFHRQP